MLHIVGMGLKPEHLTLEAADVLKKADIVYFEVYTVPNAGQFVKKVEEIIGKEVIPVEREFVEENFPLDKAREKDVALLVPGDPLTATTHVSLVLEARKQGILVRYVPGISILTVAPSLAGLQHYRFGKTVTVPKMWKEMRSYVERIEENLRVNAHTLILVDIGMGKEEVISALSDFRDRKFVLVARATNEDEIVFFGTLDDLRELDWGYPPYTLILPANMHPVEEEYLEGLNERKI